MWPTFRCCKSVASLHPLSSLMRVTRGNLMEIPPAVCRLDALNSAPIISHTGATCTHTHTRYFMNRQMSNTLDKKLSNGRKDKGNCRLELVQNENENEKKVCTFQH